MAHLKEPATGRMHRQFVPLLADETVAQSLDRLRRHPPSDGAVYFYVTDEDGRLLGVVPARRLLLSPPEAAVAGLMVPDAVTLPASATVLDACRLFIQYRLLALPVVDEGGRLLGVLDVEPYKEDLRRLERATVVGRLVQPVARFMQVESSGGLVLLAATAAALLLANSPYSESFHAFWETHAGLTFGDSSLVESLRDWIGDGLMTLFFFVVGLEIKREIVSGELADPRKALLPVLAAVGGMVVPAAVYALCLWGRPGWRGWGVPMATDIAFVVGFLTLLGPRVPSGLKVLLLTLAIADDIGAVLVIAVAYSGQLDLGTLALAGAGLGLVPLLRWLGVRSATVHAALGAAIWLGFLKSGVHPTVAGVLLGLLTPTRPPTGRGLVLDVIHDLNGRLRGIRRGTPEETPELASPAERLEHALHPWVAFAIMPLFALANAGVRVEAQALATPIALAVAAGLVLGKPIGIVLFSALSVRMGWARLPDGVDWRAMIGAGCLGGIGFTMSLFIAGLALDGPLLDEAKIGVLVGSAASAILGCLLLIAFLPSRAPGRDGMPPRA
ncbi:Na(+)/H(+) antiporter NhaA [Aquisphaera giovannonii]|uniref:Na(+)/H(+) antiporter NhaA n=2 Tax=Aquisphaera giovannonii TaxID=406548 RepID=A0A5B9W522_9BACT|nr:Na(+)/H(+) antiporter NhaA [Aquisphaera giovannonii]